jgi:hypothetical protein
MVREPAHWKNLPAGFGDRVRIRQAAETQTAGIAGRMGVVHGVTTVSVTGVDVIGTPAEDTALNVKLDDSEEAVWLAPELIEFVDHDPGSTITILGVPKTLTRASSGEWVETPRTLAPREWPVWIRRIFRRR